MQFVSTLYDSEGNKIPTKPGHVWAINNDACVQIPISTEEVKLIYKPPNESLKKQFRCCDGWNWEIDLKDIKFADEKIHHDNSGKPEENC